MVVDSDIMFTLLFSVCFCLRWSSVSYRFSYTLSGAIHHEETPRLVVVLIYYLNISSLLRKSVAVHFYLWSTAVFQRYLASLSSPQRAVQRSYGEVDGSGNSFHGDLSLKQVNFTSESNMATHLPGIQNQPLNNVRPLAGKGRVIFS